MNCNICNNEFKYIDGLKFCPYCGSKLNIQFVASDDEEGGNNQYGDTTIEEPRQEQEKAGQSVESSEKAENDVVDGEVEKVRKKLHDTLEMPPITDEDIKKDKKLRRSLRRTQILSAAKRAITSKKFIIFLSAILVLGLAAFLTVNLFNNKSVDEVRIRQDIAGKTIILPKGGSFEIKKDYIQDIKIAAVTPDKNNKQLEYLDVKMIFNNKSIEVKGTFKLTYKHESKNQWKLNDKIMLNNDVVVKPVAGMEEAKLIDELKKQKISVAEEDLALGDGSVKSLKVLQRTPNFDAGTETVLVGVTVDSGIITSAGNVTASLSFADESWKLASVSRSSDQDFKLALSRSISDDSILAQIKKKPLQENVTYPTVFGGREFAVSDKFTKSMKVTEKNFDEAKKLLSVSVRRENAAGVINSTLTTNYSLSVSMNGMVLSSNSKSKVEAVTVADISKDSIAPMLVGAEMKMGSQFLWWSESHTITADEAKTLKISKIVTRKDVQNARYVYGDISYKDGKKVKTASIVAIFLVSGDGSGGYAWKLDSVISSESDQYQYYRQDVIENQ